MKKIKIRVSKVKFLGIVINYCRIERSNRRVSLSCVLCTTEGELGRGGKLPLPSMRDQTKLTCRVQILPPHYKEIYIDFNKIKIIKI
jgi:hypothetical protein